MTDYAITQFVRRQGFRITAAPSTSPGQYMVRSLTGRHAAFVGSWRECYIWILGYCWNRGAS